MPPLTLLNMIVNFPKPFADELVYSLIARYLWLQPTTSLKCAAESVFATRNALAVVDLPARLGALSAAIGVATGMNTQRLIRNHTLLPLYSPFIPTQRLGVIEQDLTENGGGSVHFRVGIMAGLVRPVFRLRFCPRCAADERAKYGEAYWHRLHQTAGVFVCPEHHLFLEESAVPIQYRRTRHLFVPAQDVLPEVAGRKLEVQDPDHQTLLRLAQRAEWLLQNYQPGNELSDLQVRYLNLAMKLGFVTGYENIRWKVLLAEYHKRFSPQLLEQLQCSIPEGNSDHWLARILRKPRAVQAPIRHLVLMEFLGVTPEAFFTADLRMKLFGEGPWVCDNPVCPGTCKPVIASITCAHSYEHCRPVGISTCPICGQVICRVRSEHGENKWIRDFGPKWKQCLAKLWIDPTVSVRQIATTLGVDSLTVKRHAAKAGMIFPRMAKRVAGREGPPKVGGKKYSEPSALVTNQEEWCRLLLQHPSATATQLRHLAPGCYAYLYRHHPAWLREHLPAIQPTRQKRARVNWPQRDFLLSQRVVAARQELLSEAGHPKWISISALGRQMKALAWIQKHAAKLPLTRRQLSLATESRIEFAMRRIVWAAEQWKTLKGPISPWLLMQKAAVRMDLRYNPTIREAVQHRVTGHSLPSSC
jgi:hypothetical protein